MRGLAFVVTLVLLIRSCLGLRHVEKCCDEGDVLTFNASGKFECVKIVTVADDYTIPELFVLQQQQQQQQNKTRGLPRCDENSSYLSQKLWEDTKEDTAITPDSCLEIFFDQDSLQNFPVIVYCNPAPRSRSRLGSLNYFIESLSVNKIEAEQPGQPRILNFRKCCPAGSYYDADKKLCLEGGADFKLLVEHLQTSLDFIDVYSGAPACEHVLFDYKVPLADVRYDTNTSHISVIIRKENQLKNVSIDEHNTCLDVSPVSDFIVTRICREKNYCEDNPCIRKCCPESAITSCLQEPFLTDIQAFRASVAATASNNNLTQPLDTQKYGLITGRPCDFVYSDTEESWVLGKLGEIIVLDDSSFNHANSCLEFVYNYSEIKDGLHAFFCFPQNDEEYYSDKPKIRYMITAVLVLMSCFFLFVTLLVYICLPSLRNLHGKTIMCHVASLFLAYACLAANTIVSFRLEDDFNEDVADIICKYLGYTLLFSFFASFLWLNVMCFDIWWTFGGLHGASSASAKRTQQRNRFLSYCAYAWGLALLLTGLVILSEKLRLLGSRIGRERCWFDNDPSAEALFFTSPITVTLLVNIVFFIITSHRCSKVKAEIKRAMANMKDPKTRKFHSDRMRLIMNLKLFIVMGIPWLLETLTSYLSNYYVLPVWLQLGIMVPDVVNSLQGLWIFILFALKSKVYQALRKRFGSDPCKPGGSGSGNLATLKPSQGNLLQKSTSCSSTLTSNFVMSSST